jgi:predicted nuclease of predicted toxin-antitoxin system
MTGVGHLREVGTHDNTDILLIEVDDVHHIKMTTTDGNKEDADHVPLDIIPGDEAKVVVMKIEDLTGGEVQEIDIVISMNQTQMTDTMGGGDMIVTLMTVICHQFVKDQTKTRRVKRNTKNITEVARNTTNTALMMTIN